MTRLEIKQVKFKEGEDCYRCGMSKKDLKKEYSECKSWGKLYGRHLFKANSPLRFT